MVKVVFDTTVFENGFNGRSAEVPLLGAFLRSSRSGLCIPTIVYEEACNRVRKRVAEANSKISSVQRLTGGNEGFQTVGDEDALRAYQRGLSILFADLGAQLLPYPNVKHEDLVKRSLVPRKPFVDSGRGYRDALIWYSVLELLPTTSDELVLVSENAGDWCGSSKDQFHEDFIFDLRNKGVRPERLTVVSTLAEFNRKYTVSDLPVQRVQVDAPEVDYRQVLIDRTEFVATQMLVTVPDLLRQVGNQITVVEAAVVGMGSPSNISSDPPRTLDTERRLLQFGADYRVSLDLILTTSQAPDWMKRFPSAFVSMQQYLGEGLVRLYITLSLRTTFRMIQRGENTEQFSLASAEFI